MEEIDARIQTGKIQKAGGPAILGLTLGNVKKSLFYPLLERQYRWGKRPF